MVQLHPVARQPISPVLECCSNCRGDQRWGRGEVEGIKEESGWREKVYNGRAGSKRGEDRQL